MFWQECCYTSCPLNPMQTQGQSESCCFAHSLRNFCLSESVPFKFAYAAWRSALVSAPAIGSALVSLAWPSASVSAIGSALSPWAWSWASWVQAKRKEATSNRKQNKTKRNNSSSTMSNLFQARKFRNRFHFAKRQSSSWQHLWNVSGSDAV